jgi:hypothetical protein
MKKARYLFLFVSLMFVMGLSSLSVVQAADNDVNWAGLYHDSRDPLYRSPTGAVPTGTEVRLRLRAADGDLTRAQVRVWNDRIDQNTVYDMVKVADNVTFAGDAMAYEFWEIILPSSSDPTVYWYRFIATDGTDIDYYEDDPARTGGPGQVYDESADISWQLTHYKAGFQTPDWVKNGHLLPDFHRSLP